MYVFVLVADANLAVSRILLQCLLACRNLTLDSEDLFCWCKQKSDFYELWQHTTWTPTHKFHQQQQNH